MGSKLVCLALLAAGSAVLAQQSYDSVSQSTVMAPMRDGVKLATDVYRPARAGAPVAERLPALLVRTPYNRAGLRNLAEALARRGFVAVSQDVRGRFASEGDFYPFINEGLDGYDAVEWVAAQPWCDGKVGMFGGSYLAWDQYHAAMYKPPHLAALFAIVGGSHFYDEYAYPGGIPNLGWARWILSSAATGQQAARKPEVVEKLKAIAANPAEWLSMPSGPRGDVFRELPAHEKIYRDFFAHPEVDSYWKQRGFWTEGYHHEIKDIPMFFLTGWYDYFAEGVLENFAALASRQKTAKRLMVGPWPHGTGQPTCGDASFGPSAAVPHPDLIADWFDHCFRAREFRWPEPVRIFRMGGGEGVRREGKLAHGGEWRTAPSWPPPGGRAARYYLQAGKALRTTAPAAAQPSSWQHDPLRPVPTIGGRYDACAQDQVCTAGRLGCTDTARLDTRPDVLSFVSETLPSGMEVTGRPKARLWVSAEAPTADFIVRLSDVYPDGYALILAEGQLRLKAAAGRTREVEIPLDSTSNWFAAGHRIRLDIAASSFPRNETNPAKGRQTVYHQPGRASYLELPAR
jgi:putative CocE/NonD family hydrolase